jgi:hypothetical protein
MIVGEIQTLTEPVRNDQIAVGLTSVIVADIRPETLKRRDILFRNTSLAAADIITIALGNQTAIANKGIVLQQGESFSFSTETSNLCPQCQFSAICATANGLLSVMER